MWPKDIDSPLRTLLYVLAFPIVLVSLRLGLSANSLTYSSLVIGLAAAGFLAFGQGVAFAILFFLSLLLDFADGSVARMTETVTTSQFDLDGFSGRLVITATFIGGGIFYSNNLIWVLFFLAGVSYLAYSDFNIQVTAGRLLSSNDSRPLAGVEQRIRSWGGLARLARLVWNSVFTVHGHTLLVLLFLPIGVPWALVTLSYWIGLMALSIFLRILSLRQISRFT